MRTKTTTTAYGFAMLVCLLTCFSPLMAQQKNNLEYKHSGFGLLNKKYFLNDVKISKNKVAALLEKENQEAYRVFKSARALSITGTVICLPAGALFIYGMFGYVLSGFDENGGIFLAGVLGLAGGITLVSIGNSKFKKAGHIYSHTNSSTSKMNLNFGLTRSGGVGFTVSL